MDLSNYTDNAVEIIKSASELATSHSHPQITPIHLLAAMIPTDETHNNYLKTLVEKGRYDWPKFQRSVNSHLVKTPAQNPPPSDIYPSQAFSLVLKGAEKYKTQQKDDFIGQDHILFALLDDSSVQKLFKDAGITIDGIKTQISELRGNRRIDSRQADSSTKFEFLSKYADDLTQLAIEGKIDPVIGREEEIRRTIRILARKKKSNACLVGDPGVGKTTIVEGVAQRIVDNDVPSILQNAKLYALDLGALKAGAKYQGEFEERMKGVLNDCKESKENNQLVILFIDEIHMLMGDGKGDAANLLKPMLASGELTVIGATTAAEYRAYVEKDGAFERRFQRVEVKEPNIDETVTILRGLQPKYEIHHGVRILDSALVTAAQLASRYLTYRKLPDSAVDLIDEAAATIAVARDSKPEELDSLERAIQLLEVEIKALERDQDADSSTKERLKVARQKYSSLKEQLAPIEEKYKKERLAHTELTEAKKKLDELEIKAQDAERRHDTATAADLRYYAIPGIEERIAQLEVKVAEEEELINDDDSMIKNVVDSEIVAETAARLTGIPVSKLTQAENAKLINMENVLAAQVVGQGEAIKAVSNAIRLTRSGLSNPRQPSSFLFLGLSGSGKTELAKKLADFLFADEKAMIRIDCSELGEKHSVSKLIGTTAGYIGYDEGGMLTNQLARHPYSVVLFDEVEKAAPEVLNIMLQMLDDGRITASNGKVVDCSNCIVIMTSNLGAEYINAAKGTKVTPETKELVMNAVRAHFRPEFLNRISATVVFNRLSRKAIAKIVEIRLKEIQKRFEANGKNIKLDVDKDVIDYLCQHGYSSDLGARPLNRLIQTNILNNMAVLILKGQIKDKETVHIQLGSKGIEVVPNHTSDDVDMDIDVDDWTDAADSDDDLESDLVD